MSLCDSRLLSIQVPDILSRLPKSLEDIGHWKGMYRLHHEVEVSTGFTHRGPEARGCVNRVETEPSDVTDLYHGLRGPDNVSTA